MKNREKESRNRWKSVTLKVVLFVKIPKHWNKQREGEREGKDGRKEGRERERE